MATPPVNSACSMRKRTGGTRQPYSAEATAMDRICTRTLVRLGCEADVPHEPERDREEDEQDEPTERERHPQAAAAGDEAAGRRAAEHGGAGDHLAPAEDGVEIAVEAGRLQRVDQPGLHRAGEERETEPQSIDTTAQSQNDAWTCHSRT